ncbi:hypothetical protein [Synechococcus sp. CCY 9618]|nr:hypothetical protein [Synechococcus sp. CCY 9618]
MTTWRPRAQPRSAAPARPTPPPARPIPPVDEQLAAWVRELALGELV